MAVNVWFMFAQYRYAASSIYAVLNRVNLFEKVSSRDISKAILKILIPASNFDHNIQQFLRQ